LQKLLRRSNATDEETTEAELDEEVIEDGDFEDAVERPKTE
jgi:hypothetical protein